LLADLLYQAIKTNDPLVKVIKICEAAYTSTQKDKLNIGLIDAAYTVANSLTASKPEKLYAESGVEVEAVRITWAFEQNEENWIRYIQPWQKIGLHYFPLATVYCRRTYPGKPSRYGMSNYEHAVEWGEVKEKVNKDINEMPAWKQFFEYCTALAINSFYSLKTEFSRWVLIQLLEIQATIAEEIDPLVWKELQTFSPRAENKEDEQDGDQMGQR